MSSGYDCRMNIAQLRHLIAVAETGSFTRAAELVHLTQPALSRSVQTLEEELGLQLIDRIGKRNQISIIGRSIVERARRIIAETDELKDVGPQLRSADAGRLGIGLGGGPGAVLGGPLLRHFAVNHPRLKLTVSRAPTSLLLESLRDRSLDLLVLDARAVPPSPDLRIDTLPEMAAGFFCRKGHPLARQPSVRPQDLKSFPVGGAPLSNEVARMIIERFGPKWHPSEFVTLTCDEVTSLVQSVLETDAIFLGIAAALREPLNKGKAVCLPIWPGMSKVGRFGLVTLANRSQPPALDLLRAFVRQELRDDPEWTPLSRR